MAARGRDAQAALENLARPDAEGADAMTPHPFQHEAMATYFEIVIAHASRDYARQAAEAAFRELDRLEKTLSRFIESSDISRANGLVRGATTTITHDTLECLLIATDVSLATGRAFDPGYASVRPADLATDAPPYTLDPEAHTLTSHAVRLQLDLGAVGKGYALDKMMELLRDWEIAAACLNAGGSSVIAIGSPSPEETAWHIGIGEGAAYRTIPLCGASLSGSGTAVKGAHLIDPRTGRPAERTERVWAFAPTAAQADALSTAFFLMPEAEVAALCAAHPQIGAALTTSDDQLLVHGALRSMLAA
jgi:FAD:protein FMN transferase